MPELKRLTMTRIVSTPTALDQVVWPTETRVMRIAPDEVLILPELAQIEIDDPHVIVVTESGFAGLWLDASSAAEILAQTCQWELPSSRPAFAQGAVADIPTKLWFEPDQTLFIVPAPYAADFEERLS